MNTETAQLILTGSLVAITGYYAWQTRRTVRVMDEANETNNRPVVSISLRERDKSISFLDFVITNAGNGLARDIRLKVKGNNFLVKKVGSHKEFLKDFKPVKNGMKVLAPEESRRYWFVSVLGRVEELQKTKTKLEISYFNHDKTKTYSDVFDFDFLSLPEYSLGQDPQYQSAKELEKIRKELEQIRQGIK